MTLTKKLILVCFAIAVCYVLLNLGWGIYFLRVNQAPSKNLLLIFWTLSFSGLGLALALGLWLAKRIKKPIQILTQKAEGIAQGDARGKIELKGEKELEELSRGLDKISNYLQNLQSQFSSKFLMMHEDLQRTLKELSRQEEELVRSAKLASMGKLAASVAHEINNPLTGIRTLAKILLDQLAEENVLPADLDDFKKYLFLIETEATRCGTIVKNLLAFARQDKMKIEPVDLNQVLERCLTLMEYNFKAQKISLHKEFQQNLPTVSGDFSQIQQSLMAILINAVEAMSRGGQLFVRTTSNHSQARVEITDTGSGISPENLPYIFDPFFTTKEKGKGLGLGLSVAYGIIQNHQGKIEVRSELGKGTTFQISFPISRKKESH